MAVITMPDFIYSMEQAGIDPNMLLGSFTPRLVFENGAWSQDPERRNNARVFIEVELIYRDENGRSVVQHFGGTKGGLIERRIVPLQHVPAVTVGNPIPEKKRQPPVAEIRSSSQPTQKFVGEKEITAELRRLRIVA